MRKQGEKTGINYKCHVCDVEPGEFCIEMRAVDISGRTIDAQRNSEGEFVGKDASKFAGYLPVEPERKMLTCHSGRVGFKVETSQLASSMTDGEIRKSNDIKVPQVAKPIKPTRFSKKHKTMKTPKNQTTMFGGK